MADAGVIGIKIVGDASGLTAAVQTAGREVDSFGAKTKQTASGVESLANGLKSAFVGSSVAVGLIGLKNTMGEFTAAMVQAQVQADKLRNGLNFAVGKGAAGAELEFIRGQAKGLGLEFVTTAQQYTKLAAAARGTSLEGDKARQVFESIAQASTVMGLSAQETEGALLAVTQIISKGKVQAEELRGQLGERLPGAFQIAARAMGVTTAELDKMLETGKVLSTDFLPKFAAQLTQEVAPDVEAASKSMQASINRLNNAWTDFKQTVSGAGVSAAIARESVGVSQYIEGLRDAMENAKKSGAGLIGTLSTGLGTAIARAPFDVLALAANTLNGSLNFASLGALKLKTNLTLLPEIFETNAIKSAALASRLTEAQTNFTSLQEALKKNPEDIYLKSQTYQAYLLTQQLQAAKDAQDKLSGNNATREGIIANGQGRTAYLERVAAEKKAQQAALAKFNNEFGTPQDKLSAEISRQKELLGDLYSPALEAKIRAHFIKPTKDAGDAFADQRAAAKDWEKFYLDFVDLRRKAENNFDGLLPAQAKLAEFLQSPGYQNMDEPARQLALQEAYAAVAAQQLDAVLKEQTKTRDELLKKLQGSATEQEKSLLRYEDEANALAVSTAQNISLASAVELVAAARLNEALAIQLSYGDEEAADAIRREIDARKQLSKLIDGKEAREGYKKSMEDAAGEVSKAADGIQSAITDALFRGFESGKGFGENLRDTLVNTFKTMVLRPIISAVVNPVAGAAASALGFSGAANASTVPTLVNIAGITTAASGALGAGFSLALSGGTGLALEGGAAMLASATGLSSAAAGLAQIAGALAPWALGAVAIASLLKGGEYVQSLGESVATVAADKLVTLTGSGGNNDVSISGGLNIRQTETSDKFVGNLASAFVKAATQLGISTSGASFGAGFNNSDGGKFAVEATVGGAKYDPGQVKYTDANLALEASRAVFFALQSSELPGFISKVFDGITASTAAQADIDAALKYAGGLKQIRDALTETREPLQILQDAVAASFVALGTSAETFKTDFVSAIDAGISPEKLAQFQQLGVNLDALAQSSGTAAGAVRSLTDIANERKSLDDRFAQATLTEVQLLERTRNALDKSNQARFDEVIAAEKAKDAFANNAAEILRVAGTLASQQTKNPLLNTDPASISANAIKLGLTEGALFETLNKIAADEKAAAEARFAERRKENYAAAAEAFSRQMQGTVAVASVPLGRQSSGAGDSKALKDQLDELQLSAVEKAAKARAALDSESRGIFDQLEKAKAVKAAAEEAAKALEKFNDAMRGLTDTNAELQIKLLEVMGDMAGAQAATRARDIAKLTEGFSGDEAAKLIAQYDANEALKLKIEDLTKAQQDAASAADKLKSTWASITDGLLKEVDRIRGVMAETAADSYAALESRFAIATAQARAGDQTAAGNLTSYSGQLSSAITEQAGSRNELVRLQAQLAQSLQDTAVILGAPVTPVYAPPVLNSEKLEASIATLSAKIVSLEGQLSAINSNTNRTALATETLVDLAP